MPSLPTSLLRLGVASLLGTIVQSDGEAVVAVTDHEGASSSVAAMDGASSDITQVAIPWSGATVQDLHREYGNIFKYGNRNAASHRWSTFLLERSAQMTEERLELMFSGFCAVSGSPVRPVDYNRYRLTLPEVTGGKRTGYMHYCCWPCVCDTQDFIRIDTKNITTAQGTRQYHFTVLGNPCDHPEKLSTPFVQPFDRRETTVAQEAREVRCDTGVLEGATLSDHGFPIINMFFDAEGNDPATGIAPGAETPLPDPTPGRTSTGGGGVLFQDEREFTDRCAQRAAAGYNSGMGEIFRRVGSISPIEIGEGSPAECEEPMAVGGGR
jgi:hypothetical protein